MPQIAECFQVPPNQRMQPDGRAVTGPPDPAVRSLDKERPIVSL